MLMSRTIYHYLVSFGFKHCVTIFFVYKKGSIDERSNFMNGIYAISLANTLDKVRRSQDKSISDQGIRISF